jgi:hypothetical protein
MRPTTEWLWLVLILGAVNGCSIRSEDLSKDSIHGPIKYAVVRGEVGPTSHQPASPGDKADAPLQ